MVRSHYSFPELLAVGVEFVAEVAVTVVAAVVFVVVAERQQEQKFAVH